MRAQKILLFGAMFAAVSSGAALAQSTSTANTSSGTASVTTNVTAISAGTPTTTDNTVHYNESGHLWTTPNVQGSYFSGANPCLVGVGGGGAGGPVGLSFTWGRNDEGCQRRSDAAAWHALGLDRVAIARMCQDDDNKKAFESAGFSCPGTIKTASAAPAATPVVVQQAVPPPPRPAAARPASAQPQPAPSGGNPRPANPPAWCSNANQTDKLNEAYVHYMCGK